MDWVSIIIHSFMFVCILFSSSVLPTMIIWKVPLDTFSKTPFLLFAVGLLNPKIMLDREFNAIIEALETIGSIYQSNTNSASIVEGRSVNPSRILLKISGDNWKQNLQNVLQYSYINFTRIGAVRQIVFL